MGVHDLTHIFVDDVDAFDAIDATMPMKQLDAANSTPIFVSSGRHCLCFYFSMISQSLERELVDRSSMDRLKKKWKVNNIEKI